MIERTIMDGLVRYGAPVLFFAQAFGLFGLPIPDELLLTVAGALIRKGQLNATTTIGAAWGGALFGVTLSYGLGRVVGVRVLRKKLHLHEESVDRAVRWFRRFGGWLLAFGYFVPGVRHVTSILAGSAPLDFPVFAGYAYAGGILWCSVFLALGYYAGGEWHKVTTYATAHALLVSILVAIGVAVFAFAWYRRRA